VVAKRIFAVCRDSVRGASLWITIVLAEQFLIEEASSTLKRAMFFPRILLLGYGHIYEKQYNVINSKELRKIPSNHLI